MAVAMSAPVGTPKGAIPRCVRGVGNPRTRKKDNRCKNKSLKEPSAAVAPDSSLSTAGGARDLLVLRLILTLAAYMS